MPSVLAIFAHPDDIEFVAAGTLIRLKDCGWEVHYLNVANGCCGSTTTGPAETAAIREQESRRAAARLGAHYYPPICNDLEVAYTTPTVQKIAAIVRRSKPTIVLTHAPVDYMEDHMQTCRLALTATFARAAPNFTTDPPVEVWDGEVAVYHAQPHGNRLPVERTVVKPELTIAIDEVMDRKLQMLEEHRSQLAWLQSSQGLNSYCQTMLELCEEVARNSGRSCRYAEGWRRHLHWGYSPAEFDPLTEVLRD